MTSRMLIADARPTGRSPTRISKPSPAACYDRWTRADTKTIASAADRTPDMTTPSTSSAGDGFAGRRPVRAGTDMTTPPTSSVGDSSEEAGHPRTPGRPETLHAVSLQWCLGGLLAAPFAILPHEIGHYLVLLAFDVPDLTLHYVAVTWDLREFWEAIQRADFDGANAVVPVWAVALSDAMGPMVTYAIVAGCCYACVRWQPFPAFVAVAVLSQLRIRAGAGHVVREALGIDRPANYDELRVAVLTGIPVEALVGFALLTLLVSVIWLSRFLPPGRRLVAVGSMTGGMAVSLYLYAGVIGPWLLP